MKQILIISYCIVAAASFSVKEVIKTSKPGSFYSTTDGLILSNSQGISKPLTVYGANSNITRQEGMTQGKMDGSGSYFVVYSVPNYNIAPIASNLRFVVVDSEHTTEFGFTAQSAQGFNKDGITVFSNFFFCGNGKTYTSSTTSITADFPRGSPGASSIIITKGWWSLYTEENYQGIVSINHGTRFGPGTRITGLQSANDKVKSIKCFETATGN